MQTIWRTLCAAGWLFTAAGMARAQVDTETELRDEIQEALDDETSLSTSLSDDITLTQDLQNLTQNVEIRGAGTISGGDVRVIDHTLLLGDNVSFTGNINVQGNSSILVFGSNTIFGGAGSVTGNDAATLRYDSDLDRTISDSAFWGTFTDFLTFDKSGDSTLIFGTAFSLESDITITEGTIRLDIADALNASHRVTIQSSGKLDLNGNSQSIGSLAGDGAVDLGDNADATLTVGDNGEDSTFAGVIRGAGGLLKTGSGQFDLSGENEYTGLTVVEGGTLRISGSIAGDAYARSGGVLRIDDSTFDDQTVNVDGNVDIEADGALIGNGTIGGSLSVAGSLDLNEANDATGDKVVVDGDYTHGSDATLRINASHDGTTDSVQVGGDVTIQGGKVVVDAARGTYAASTEYTIISAGGDVTGTFSSVETDLSFLDPSLAYEDDTVTLSLTRNDVAFSDVAVTANQRAVSEALSSTTADADGTLKQFIDAITGSSDDDARSLFDQLSGDSYASILSAGLQGVRSSSAAITQRLVVTRALQAVPENDPRTQAEAGREVPDADAPLARRIWVEGLGGNLELDADDNGPGVDADTAGVIIGVDDYATDQTLVGAAFAYASTDAKTKGRDAGSDITTFSGWGYANRSFDNGDRYLAGAVGGAYQTYDSHRTLLLNDTPSEATANHDAFALGLRGEYGHNFRLRSNASVYAQPFVAMEYTSLFATGFEEDDAGTAGLSVDDTFEQSLRASAGVRVWVPLGDSVALGTRAVANYELLDDPTEIDAQFLGGGSSFTVSGPNTDPLTFELGAGLVARLPASIEVYVDLGYGFSGDGNEFTATFGLAYGF